MLKNAKYWVTYFNSKKFFFKNSSFSKFSFNFLKNFKGDVIDIGCGDGRDLIFFYKKTKKVIGIDKSKKAIEVIRKKHPLLKSNVFNGNFSKIRFDKLSDFYAIYSRFSLHAINKKEEKNFFKNLKKAKNNEYLFIETRTIKDELFGKGKKLSKNEFVHGHYRRFIFPEELKKKIKKLNYKILYFKIKKNFAKLKSENPCVLRLIAKKK